MAFLNVKMQLDAAPGEALVQQVGKGGRLAEVPFPAALASESVGKVRQVRRVVRGDHLGVYPFAVMAEERLLDRLANLLMGNARQQLNQVRHPPAHRGNAFSLQLFLVRVEVVGETA